MGLSRMSSGKIFRATLIILLTLTGAYVLILSVHIVIVLLMAVIVASAVRPLIQNLTRWHIPESIAIIIVYLGLAIVITAIFIIVMPPVVNQVAGYIENDGCLAYRIIQAQRHVENIISNVTNDEVSLVAPDEVQATVSNFIAQVRQLAPGMLDNLGSTIGDAILIFVMGAYWLTSHQKAIEFISQLTPGMHRDEVRAMINEIETTLGAYVRGVATISLIVGILNFVVMQLLGVPDALPLAFIIAVTTTIPMIGGLIGGSIVVVLTLVTSPEHVPVVFIIFFTITQFENYILTPRVMGRNVKLDPLLIIIYTAIGFIMLGIVGALTAVPIMRAIHILLTYLVINPYKESLKGVQIEDGSIQMVRIASSHQEIRVEQVGKLPN